MSAYDRAMTSATEYRRLAFTHGASDARCRQLRNDIDTLVGRWVGEEFVLPDAIRREMGLATSDHSRPAGDE